jgi:uncharacterized lipoprotein
MGRSHGSIVHFLTMTRALAAALLVASLAACSGSEGGSKESEKPTTAQPAATPSKEEESERKLHAAQESAVEAMCERLADCAVEDANKTMTPEERKEKLGNVDELIPRYRAECEEEANKSDLSPRQVKIVQTCVVEKKTCATFVPCLDEAQKK